MFTGGCGYFIVQEWPKHDCSNYRPTSLLSTLAKIHEKLINFLEKTHFFSHKQFGFREGLSTEYALQNFMESVFDGLNLRKKVSRTFLDIKKAFDTADPKIIK